MKFISRQKGFTLIEMIISLAIFTVVAVIAVGALLKIIDANKKSQTLKSAINNINFALESMSREMRVGSTYSCNPSGVIANGGGNKLNAKSCETPVSGSNWIIAFSSSKRDIRNGGCNLVYAYKFDGKTLGKLTQKDCNNVTKTTDDFAPVISPEVNITDAQIKVFSNDSSRQSYAWFHFKGYTGVKEKNKTYFDIQTSVSQRLSD
jgi:prepilin-type N-terminal cleavage/methylation domain-containing protein